MTNYIIGDFISRLNVASRTHLSTAKVPKVDILLDILSLLYENGVIRGFFVKTSCVIVYLKYTKNKSVFSSLKLISSPVKGFFEL